MMNNINLPQDGLKVWSNTPFKLHTLRIVVLIFGEVNMNEWILKFCNTDNQ